MGIKKTLLNYLFFSVLCHNFFVDCFFMRVLNDILQSKQSFLIVTHIFDVLIDKYFNDVLGCLIAVLLNQIVNDKLIQIEQMPELLRLYYSFSMREFRIISTWSHFSDMIASINWLVLTMLSEILDSLCKVSKDSVRSISTNYYYSLWETVKWAWSHLWTSLPPESLILFIID